MPYYGVPLGQTSEDVGMNFNKEIIHDLLQEELGFEGVVCTDWAIITGMKFLGLTLMEATDHGVEHLDNTSKVEKALNAGVDQFGGEYTPEHIIKLVKDGRITEERVDRSVRKLLMHKFQLGLFDDPFLDEEASRRICKNEVFQAAGKEAMLDMIFGMAEPGGKLPFEIPSSMKAVEEQMEDIPCDSKDPLFPFGHGLSYRVNEETGNTGE